MYFGIMYLLVILFNVVVISKYKIIDLLSAGKKIETVKFKNPIIYVITFILCLVSILVAYKLVIKVGLDYKDSRFIISILLGVIGTVLFFFSLSGFGLYIVKKSKNLYFEGLNIFIVKQINSKVNTNFISMSIICLMLFLTMGILSTGISFKSSLEEGLKDSTPFDASASVFVYGEQDRVNIKDAIESADIDFNNGEEYAYFNEYFLKDIKIGDTLNKNVSEESKKILEKLDKSSVIFVKESEYNSIRELYNKEPIVLKDDEVLILSNVSETLKVANDYIDNNDTITIDNKEYLIKNNKAIEDNLISDYFKNNMLTIVVDDKVLNGFDEFSSNININYSKENRDASEAKFSAFFKQYYEGKFEGEFIHGKTREGIYAENKGMTTSILFVGIYLGIIFLIASMAVLALQQLSEASDSIERYKSLKKLGANNSMINKTIFVQTLIYFSLPVGLAFIHAVVGIKVANDFIAMFNKPDIGTSSLMTAFVFIIVYVGYFYATYIGYKNIVKNS
ncbi:MAG: ABC transporter permease [Peptostreptococcaceae bacterium]